MKSQKSERASAQIGDKKETFSHILPEVMYEVYRGNENIVIKIKSQFSVPTF